MRMKELSLIVVLLSATSIFAQNNATIDTSYWKSGSQSTITFSQVSLTNWAAGGESSSSINGFFTGFADYEDLAIGVDDNELYS